MKLLSKRISHYFLILTILTSLPLNNANPRIKEQVPSVFFFGDSIIDTGNNNVVKTIVRCNFPPYGRDFQGHIPTGRFCNGKIPSDYIAQLFGVKDVVPAYFAPNLHIQDLLTGVSFASGGAGYDPLTSELVSVIPLSDQLNLFRGVLRTLRSAVGEQSIANVLSKGVFVVCAGSDDVANTYFTTPFRRAHYDINSYTDLMINSASSFYQELYALGIRRIAVLNLPPLGCVPSQRTLQGGLQRDCAEVANQAALLFNSKLISLIDSLNQKLSGARITYFDIYTPLYDIIQHPAKYGFQVADRGCCGTGNIEVSVLCNSLEDSKTCSDASKYVFWDSYHPSERTYEILTPIVLYKSVDKLF